MTWREQKIKIRLSDYDSSNCRRWGVEVTGRVAEVFDMICDLSNFSVSLIEEIEEIQSFDKTASEEE